MSESLQFLLLGTGGIALLAFNYWIGAIGVRGGGVSREEWPVVYWFAMGVLGLATGPCFFAAIWTAT